MSTHDAFTCACPCHPVVVGEAWLFGRSLKDRGRPPRSGQENGSWFLYEITRTDTGELRYIGQTVGARNRFAAHRARYRTDEYRMTIIARYETRAEVLQAERDAIIERRPPDNVVGAEYNRPMTVAERRQAMRLRLIQDAEADAATARFAAMPDAFVVEKTW